MGSFLVIFGFIFLITFWSLFGFISYVLYIYIIYLGQFKALSNQLGVILGPFVDPLGTILGRFWGYLEPFWVHFGILFDDHRASLLRPYKALSGLIRSL